MIDSYYGPPTRKTLFASSQSWQQRTIKWLYCACVKEKYHTRALCMWESVQVNTVEHQQSTKLWLCVFLRRPVVITNLNNRASTVPSTTELWSFEQDVCDCHRITCPEPVTLWSLVLISTVDGFQGPHVMWWIMRYNTEAVSRLQLELHHSESEQQGALYQSERAAGTTS